MPSPYILKKLAALGKVRRVRLLKEAEKVDPWISAVIKQVTRDSKVRAKMGAELPDLPKKAVVPIGASGGGEDLQHIATRWADDMEEIQGRIDDPIGYAPHVSGPLMKDAMMREIQLKKSLRRRMLDAKEAARIAKGFKDIAKPGTRGGDALRSAMREHGGKISIRTDPRGHYSAGRNYFQAYHGGEEPGKMVLGPTMDPAIRQTTGLHEYGHALMAKKREILQRHPIIRERSKADSDFIEMIDDMEYVARKSRYRDAWSKKGRHVARSIMQEELKKTFPAKDMEALEEILFDRFVKSGIEIKQLSPAIMDDFIRRAGGVTDHHEAQRLLDMALPRNQIRTREGLKRIVPQGILKKFYDNPRGTLAPRANDSRKTVSWKRELWKEEVDNAIRLYDRVLQTQWYPHGPEEPVADLVGALLDPKEMARLHPIDQDILAQWFPHLLRARPSALREMGERNRAQVARLLKKRQN